MSLDFSYVFQGPVATQLLAEYGVDVIKVERPESGDWSRVWDPFVGGVSMPVANLNRNKCALSINLKHASGKIAVNRLLQRIKNPDLEPTRISLESELIIRESCGSH